jgi:site-specific recombinase XerD
MFIETYSAHNEQMKVLVGGDFAHATYIKYRTSRQHIQDFIKWKYSCDDIEVDKINYSFVAEYDYYLKSVRKCSHNSAMRYLAHLKKIVYICRKNGWIKQDPFMGFKLTKVEKDKEFLSEKEVERIYLKEFATERLNQVKDIFIFSCFTGLAYSDVQKLQRSEITQGIEGGKWIHTYRRKTDSASRIPLLPIALEIIEKYQEHPQCLNHDRVLPVLSNQKMNAYLKEIADICEIHKNLTFHTARHTFATTITLNNGVPIESVGKMLGHRNLRTTQIYAKVLDKKVSEDMRALKEKFRTGLSGATKTA